MRTSARLLGQGQGQAGYTLTEMLVVIGIIGLIAAALTPGIIGQFGRAKAKAAQLQLQTIAADVEAFSSDVQRYPTQQEGLQALLLEPASADGWTGPYVRDAKMLNDPWGRPIIYSVDQEARTFTVKSLGADGKPGGTGVNRDIEAPPAAPRAGAVPATVAAHLRLAVVQQNGSSPTGAASDTPTPVDEASSAPAPASQP